MPVKSGQVRTQSRFQPDPDKINEEKEEKQKQQDETKKYIWKPKEGENKVRIVPYRHAKYNNSIIQVYFHYNVGTQSVMCPKYNVGKKCPICDYIEDKLSVRVPRDEYFLLTRIRAKKRYFSPLVDRAEEDPTVRFWGYPERVYDQLEAYSRDPDYKTMFYPLNGRDITVTYAPPSENAKKDGNWGSTQLVPRGKETELFTGKTIDEIDDFLEANVPNLLNLGLFQILEYEVIENIFNRFMEGEDESDAEKGGNKENSKEETRGERAVEKKKVDGDNIESDVKNDTGSSKEEDFEKDFENLFESGEDE